MLGVRCRELLPLTLETEAGGSPREVEVKQFIYLYPYPQRPILID